MAVVSGEGGGTALRKLVASGADPAGWAAEGGARHRLATVRLLAPIPEPRRDIFCVGKNYRAHAAKFHVSGFDSTGREVVPRTR